MSKTFPSVLSTDRKSSVSRRSFIRQMMIVGVALNIPFFNACTDSASTSLLSEKQENILKVVFKILFPKDGNGPDIEEMQVFNYFLWMLEDPNLDPDENQYVIRGIDWLNESSQEEFEKDFLELNKAEQEKLVQFVSQTSWGESWLSRLLTIIFESLLLDPIYKVNEQGKFWTWLNHTEGSPRPNEKNSYPTILNRKLENKVISNLDQINEEEI